MADIRNKGVLVLGFVLASAFALPTHSQALVDLLGQEGDRLGTTTSLAGDFDRDGFPDLLVTADQLYKDASAPNYVFGLVAVVSGRDSRVLFVMTGSQFQAASGHAFVGRDLPFAANALAVGDLDQDGTGDLLVAYGNPRVRRKLVAFSGRTRAILFELSDPYGRTNFGDQMLALGDILDATGALAPDGVPDFAVGAPTSTVGQPPLTYPGLVHVFSGVAPTRPVRTLGGNTALVEFGSSLELVADLDGDGSPALAVGAPGGDYVELFDGPGFGSMAVLNSPLASSASFGETLANLGDFDGDGLTELAVGAPRAARSAGRVYVYSLLMPAPSLVHRIEPTDAFDGASFGSSVASLPIDPVTRRVLLDLDHDGIGDPFLDQDRNSVPDYLVAARGYETLLPGATQAGAVYLVLGTGGFVQDAREPLHQGSTSTYSYGFLAGRVPHDDDWFGSRIALLGNPTGESQIRIAIGSLRDESYRGGLSVVRPTVLRFDDNTFVRSIDVVGTSRRLFLDFGPRHAGKPFALLATSGGANPGQLLQGKRVALNSDGTGGLWERSLSGQTAGTPLEFSQLSGLLDAQGHATISLTVTGPTLGHPWFDVPSQHYLAVLTRPGQPGVFTQVSAPVPLFIF